ncbi:DUF2956 domain-containing protein [Vibrio japonicus]|uniref:DUF2956 domain-containing protein n=1 Tax=Vibrio japonicus TaxID=1824638 RepID=A0ABY5LLX9_9VIBR|nr:DUF2956 domain-containing protein [Vibrio japonicus]UUM31853.1 DUF2956 domain-containing protein [Vibrio japonicus]
MKKNVVPSQETQQEATKIANATQRPGQTKEQTRLIAQGIEKGIALYKKQQKEKARLADKAKKKAQREKRAEQQSIESTPSEPAASNSESVKAPILPWALLALSWVGFIVYIMQTQ